MRRDSVQVQKLIDRRAQQVERGWRDGRERPGGGLANEMVDGGPPTLDTQGDLACESAISRIREIAARTFEGGSQIAAPRVDGSKHFVCGPPGWCAHAAGVSKRWPGDQR